MSFIETMRERGRLKVVIKAMLGANAGRRHQDGLKLDNVTLASGEILGDPAMIHEKNTEHYVNHYALPPDQNNRLHNASDWLPFVQTSKPVWRSFKIQTFQAGVLTLFIAHCR